MSRRDHERLADILAAIDAVHAHLQHDDLDGSLVFDAVRVRLIEIGEAVKRIDPETLALMPEIPWSDVARMRDHLAHRYFDTTNSIVRDNDLRHSKPPYAGCSERLRTARNPTTHVGE